jgi:hypothetical protein
MSNGIVYFIKPQKESCYKIGMSSSSTIKRLKDYGSKSIIIQVHACSDPAFIEKLLIDAFNEEFELVKGREYFGGDPKRMLTVFNDIVNQYADWNHTSNDSNAVVIVSKDTHIEDTIKEISEGNATYDIDWYLYELLSILPDKHFNDLELLMDLVHILRNAKGIGYQTRLATMVKLLVERSWTFKPEDIPIMFTTNMTAAQKKYTYLCLIKRMKVMNPNIIHKVNEWQSKWSNAGITNQPSSSLTYSYNTMTLLSDIKKAYPKHTIKMILQMDSRFNMIRINTCKSCHNKHLKGCCKHYNRNNKTRTTYIQHAIL